MGKKIILEGLAASTGQAEGFVRIIKGNKDYAKLAEGEILVTKITDPSMVVIMSKSKAIVTDIGGITSHPAIISREFGIPCVVGTKQATIKLKTGQKVIVDGTKGKVYIEE